PGARANRARTAIGPARIAGDRRPLRTTRPRAARAIVVAVAAVPVTWATRPRAARAVVVAVATVPAAGAARLPVLPPAMMFPPGAAPAPIVEILAAQRIAVAVIVEHPHAVAGIIIAVVPAAAEPDLGEPAAIIGRVIAIIAIAVVIGIAVIIIIGVAVARGAIAARRIARTINVAIIAAAERTRGERAERDGKGTLQTLRHGLCPLGSNGCDPSLDQGIARVELNL